MNDILDPLARFPKFDINFNTSCSDRLGSIRARVPTWCLLCHRLSSLVGTAVRIVQTPRFGPSSYSNQQAILGSSSLFLDLKLVVSSLAKAVSPLWPLE